MKLKVLGCNGGIGKGLRTTSFLLDDDVLIDAGTGVGDLTQDALSKVQKVFLTHSHLDHIAMLPLLVDTVGVMRQSPLHIYALAETIDALKKNIFNWKIWPDFTMIPSGANPCLSYHPIKEYESINIGKGRRIQALPALHVVPTVGYHIDSGHGSFVFSGDSTSCPEFWEEVSQIKNLKYLAIETAFSNAEAEISRLSKHFYPELLLKDLGDFQLNNEVEIYISHLKPSACTQIRLELAELMGNNSKVQILEKGQIFTF